MELKVAFIINPISGAKNKNYLPALIKETAESLNVSADIYFTEYANHAAILTQELVNKGYNRIVAVGGDGTINEVGKELINSTAELAIIPQGSGNGLARHLLIPLSAEKAVKLALSNQSEAIDTAFINNKPFFCTAGVGFDALIGNKFAESKSRGFSTYATIATKEFIRYKPQTYKITVDGIEYTREAFLITIANASQYGNNAFIAPQAQLQDGILDIAIVSEIPVIAGPFFAAKMFLKELESSRYVEYFKGESIQIDRIAEDYIHYDGEPGRMGAHLDLRILPASLKVVF